MKEKIDPTLLEKYLSGADLTRQELATIEQQLQEEEDQTTNIADKLPDIPLSSLLKKGIQLAGNKSLKKKVIEAAQNLNISGFFIEPSAIQTYLKGTLQGEDLKIFEQRLAADKAFVERVAQEQDLLANLKQVGKKNLKAKITQVEKGLAEKGFFEKEKDSTTTVPSSTKVISIFNRRNLAIAASFLILILAYFNFSNTTPIDIDQTFANHVPFQDRISESIKDELSEIGYTASEKEIQNELLVAMTAYNQKKYDLAIPLFDEILSKQPEQLYAQLYLGQCHLNLQNWDTAGKLFHPLGENMVFPLRADALWSEAYVLLKQEKNNTAKQVLNQLLQFENTYQTKAKILLSEI